MTREQAREYVNRLDIRTLYSFTKSRGSSLYVCPICGSGTGKSRTGALQISETGSRITCHAHGCFTDRGEDTLGALELLWRTDESGVYRQVGIEIDGTSSAGQHVAGALAWDAEIGGGREEQAAAQPEMADQDYTSFFTAAHAHITETDYPQRRGLGLAVIERFNLGYVAAWKHPKAQGAPSSPRLIIPTGKSSYLARDTRPNSDIPQQAVMYAKSKVGKMQILNAHALQEARQPIYIVEGEIDALSVMEVGGEALGLGSANRVQALLNALKEAGKPAQPLIVALDNDAPGQEAASKLTAGLKAQGIPHVVFNPAGEHKDANEALVADRKTFAEAVSQGVALAMAQADEELQEEREAYEHTTAASKLQSFINGISESVNTPCIATGFEALDKALDGGFYPSLSLVGGLSSLGKTSLVLQIADQAAAAGTDVLFFSLEMAESELMSKSISRHTLLQALTQGLDTKNAKSARGITDGRRYQNYRKEERQLIESAIEAYGQYAGKIRIIRSGLGRIGVAEIREAIEKHLRLTGRRPLVVIDYLQIIKPESDRMTDKQAADAAVTGLKNLSADLGLALIAISSLNRASYKEAISMEALKESGGLEYGSDIVIGLQLRGAGTRDFDPTAAKKEDPRHIEAVILKNRNGRVGDKINFKYYPAYNYFTEECQSAASGGYQIPTKSKEQKLKESVGIAYSSMSLGVSEVTVQSMAMFMDVSEKTAFKRIIATGEYSITDNVVTRKDEHPDG